MSGIVEGVGNLFQGVLNIIWGIISTITSTIESLFGFVFSAFKGVFDLGEGLIGFVIGRCCHPSTLGKLTAGRQHLHHRRYRSNGLRLYDVCASSSVLKEDKLSRR